MSTEIQRRSPQPSSPPPEPGMGSARRRGVGLLCLASALLLAWGAAEISWRAGPRAQARVMRQHLTRFPLKPNVTVIMATQQTDHPMGSFLSQVRFAAVGESSVRFEWATYESDLTGQATRGVSMVRDINSCQSLDPWWPVREVDSQRAEAGLFLAQRCELWLSRGVFRTLQAKGTASFRPDQLMRADEEMPLVLESRGTMEVNVDGVPTLLPVLELSTETDRLWVHDSEDNPFVLRSRIAGQYQWRAVEIYIHEPPPLLPMYR